MATVDWSLRSMSLEGYKTQVQKRLAEYGYVGQPPTNRQYREAWNMQTCAKKLAASHKRRARKRLA